MNRSVLWHKIGFDNDEILDHKLKDVITPWTADERRDQVTPTEVMQVSNEISITIQN